MAINPHDFETAPEPPIREEFRAPEPKARPLWLNPWFTYPLVAMLGIGLGTTGVKTETVEKRTYVYMCPEK